MREIKYGTHSYKIMEIMKNPLQAISIRTARSFCVLLGQQRVNEKVSHNDHEKVSQNAHE